MIIIKAPDSVAACRLQHVLNLNQPDQIYIFVEEESHQLLQLISTAEPDSVKCPAEIHEGHFVSGPIVNSYVRAPRFHDVPIELVLCSLDLFREDLVKEAAGFFASLHIPILECSVTISHGLMDRRSFFQPFFQILEVRNENGKLGTFFGV